MNTIEILFYSTGIIATSVLYLACATYIECLNYTITADQQHDETL